MTTATDRYPTRTRDERTPIERRDPTVWVPDADGPIDRRALADYDDLGYLIVDRFLDEAEVQAVRADAARLASDPVVRADERTVLARGTSDVRSIFDVHRLSGLVDELVREPRVVDRVRQILGSEVYVHQSRVNYMPGFRSTGFYWHSDFETWHAEDGMPRPRALSLLLTLTENRPVNGSLMIVPGSHRTFVPCLGTTPDRHFETSLQSQEVGVPSEAALTRLVERGGIEQFVGGAGAAMLFDSNVMHGSANNITPFPRSNLFVVFNSVENVLVDPFAAPDPRPAHLASRDFTALTPTA